MIPIYLKIKGLYSYQTEQEIHFNALTDASLFGIFGAVGSGKSSILEAITFALYGDTERLNKSGDDRTYNMMNLRSDELLIDFECIAGKNAERYRFTVRGKRNSKNFKDVKTFDRRGYIWQDENWVPLLETENAESIIGLSYDNFRRTIIIPQGRFQEFIELRDAERTRMMKELFQLEKYDLSRNVGSLSKQNDLAISNVDGQLTGLGEVTGEMVAAEEKRREEVRVEIQKVSEALHIQTELEAAFQKLKLTAEKVMLLQTQLQAMETQRPQMQEREAMLKIFETCSLHFKSILDQKNTLNASIARDQKIFENNKTRLDELTKLAEKQQELLTRLQPQYEKREELLDTADELEKIIQIIDNRTSAAKRKEALTRGTEQLKEKEASIARLIKQKQDSEAENEQRKNALSDIQEISEIGSWFTTCDALIEKRQSVKAEAEALQADITAQQRLLIAKINEVNAAFALNLPENPPLEAFQGAIQVFLTKTGAESRDKNRELLSLHTKLALHQYAGAIVDGEPCPLCGSADHPAVLHADSAVNEHIKLAESEVLVLTKRENDIRATQAPVERIYNQIDNLEKLKATIKHRWADVKTQIDAHDKLFVWNKFDKNDRAGFNKQFAEITKNQADIKEADVRIKALILQIETENLEKTEQIEKPLQSLKDEILRFENTVLTLAGQLQKVNLREFEDQSKPAILEKTTAFRNSYKEITSLFEQSEKNLDGVQKERDVLSGAQGTLKTTLDSSQRDLANLQANVEAQLKAFDFESEERVKEILQKPIQIDFERKAIETFKYALDTTSRDLENLLKENAEQQYDRQQHETIIKAKEILTESLNALRKEEGGLDRLLKKMAEDLAKKAALLTEKARLQLRKEHLDDLGKLFRSSGFVDYASSIYLQNLIQAANHRFHQMTHQQLHLELGEGNSFWVRDLLNGGHLRLLKTLSGGQKFQAALSLALALADHIHVRNGSKHNFFFLDEGFGSLDKNALQTVFETLKSLRKENRIVGIISHVEDLQQEIQTYLSIEETEEGSRIVPSWK
ncbi:SMC family ATPase [Dyadobacter chenwenxiniae]|uniref:SMC family ATPase n=1 Tax=Dyadobacter chenwenxiniae TaxID=2906456 RepID=A0A9X1PNG9_9BACT|nr:SMC family ATPase [Dyadobacter chenwenxiniae]MCF0064380.1 SMC family ATPase [Dyadobacter chenwenxiniae]UON82413.1 SMC family ATPase [Dyadobacter chenwenxiniae]